MSQRRAALGDRNAPSNQIALDVRAIQRGVYSRYPDRLSCDQSVLCLVIFGWRVLIYQCYSPLRHLP